jgi:hypothetical protein
MLETNEAAYPQEIISPISKLENPNSFLNSATSAKTLAKADDIANVVR